MPIPSGPSSRRSTSFSNWAPPTSRLDFPVLYGSGLDGWLVKDLEGARREGMDDLFETIIESVPAPHVDRSKPFRMQVSTLAWSDYLGRIGCGRALSGTHRLGEQIVVTSPSLDAVVTRSSRLFATRGLERSRGRRDRRRRHRLDRGTRRTTHRRHHQFSRVCRIRPCRPLEIEEPTVSMFFMVNTGPLAGEEGKAVTLRQIKDRLERETRVNVALRVEDLGRSDGVKVSGRGELHLAILIEEMRREGVELCVSKPEVITRRNADGDLLEPYEDLVVEVPEEFQGVVIEKLARRKGELIGMHAEDTGVVRLDFAIPTRGLIGYRTEFLTETRGNGVMNSRVSGYRPWAGRGSGAQPRLARQHRGRHRFQLPAGEPAGPRHALHLPRRSRLQRHDRGRALAAGGSGLQPDEDQEAGQLPVRDEGHRCGPQGPPHAEPRSGPGVDSRGRARGGHPQLGSASQGRSGRRTAQARESPGGR